MSIVIATNGTISLTNSVKTIRLSTITDASRKRINRLVREGKAVMRLSSFNFTVIFRPESQ